MSGIATVSVRPVPWSADQLRASPAVTAAADGLSAAKSSSEPPIATPKLEEPTASVKAVSLSVSRRALVSSSPFRATPSGSTEATVEEETSKVAEPVISPLAIESEATVPETLVASELVRVMPEPATVFQSSLVAASVPFLSPAALLSWTWTSVTETATMSGIATVSERPEPWSADQLRASPAVTAAAEGLSAAKSSSLPPIATPKLEEPTASVKAVSLSVSRRALVSSSPFRATPSGSTEATVEEETSKVAEPVISPLAIESEATVPETLVASELVRVMPEPATVFQSSLVAASVPFLSPAALLSWTWTSVTETATMSGIATVSERPEPWSADQLRASPAVTAAAEGLSAAKSSSLPPIATPKLEEPTASVKAVSLSVSRRALVSSSPFRATPSGSTEATVEEETSKVAEPVISPLAIESEATVPETLVASELVRVMPEPVTLFQSSLVAASVPFLSPAALLSWTWTSVTETATMSGIATVSERPVPISADQLRASPAVTAAAEGLSAAKSSSVPPIATPKVEEPTASVKAVSLSVKRRAFVSSSPLAATPSGSTAATVEEETSKVAEPVISPFAIESEATVPETLVASVLVRVMPEPVTPDQSSLVAASVPFLSPAALLSWTWTSVTETATMSGIATVSERPEPWSADQLRASPAVTAAAEGLSAAKSSSLPPIATPKLEEPTASVKAVSLSVKRRAFESSSPFRATP